MFFIETSGSLFQYDKDVAFWNFVAVANYAARFYRYAMRDVKVVQKQLYDQAQAAVDEVEARVLKLLGDSNKAVSKSTESEVVNLLTKVTDEQAWNIVHRWNELLFELITKYHDGYEAKDLTAPHITMSKLFYPKSWLDATGYWVNKPNTGDDVILFAPKNQEQQEYIKYSKAQQMIFLSSMASAVFAVVGTLVLVYYTSLQKKSEGLLGRFFGSSNATMVTYHNHRQYQSIADDEMGIEVR